MTEPTTTERVRPELTGWKKALLAGAGVFLVIGLCLQVFGGGGAEQVGDPVADAGAQGGSTGNPAGVSGLDAEGGTGLATGPGKSLTGSGAQDTSPKIDWPIEDPADGGATSTLPPVSGDPGATPGGEDGVKAEPGAAGWSPFFLKGGFSFFAAFCVGYATRVWLKMMAFFLGTFLVGIFLLSYAGALDPNWVKIEGWYDIIVGRIESEAVDFKTFLTGSLPQAGLAGLGLVAGFKRK